MNNKYYTYAYLREDRTPYYIGKGTKYRAFGRTRRGAKPPRDKSKIIILKQNLTEEEAFKHEIYMIAVFGRKDLGTGILLNMTDGGDGVSGYKFSEESKRRKSILYTGRKRNSPSQETRDKIRKGVKEWFVNNKHKSLGKNIHNEKGKEIMRQKKCKYVYTLISPFGERYTTISPDLFCKYYPEFNLYPSKIRFASNGNHLYKKWIIERVPLEQVSH
jgi:hypothetical protein